MKYRPDYRLAIGLLFLAILVIIAIFIGVTKINKNEPASTFSIVLTILILGGLFAVPLTASFLKTRTYCIEDKKLKTNYILGLFPKEFDLDKVKHIKVIEWQPPGQVSGFYTLLTLSSKYRILKTIKIYFENGNQLKVDGQTLEAGSYIKFIKRLNKR